MARLTPERDALVIRLVYDGPPGSGKTTSLASLAGGMAGEVFSPAVEDGRTLYFDWLDYRGGNFDGLPIRCQILSVPGQADFARRRFSLLEEADAVVFVTHSAPDLLSAAASHLRELRDFLDSRPSPRPGIVVQANHRDAPDPIPVTVLQEVLGLGGLTLVESVASQDVGTRQAFVFAVRLALERARELKAQGALPAGPGETETPDLLLACLRSAEGEGRTPLLPDAEAPSGCVWPPVSGQILLHSAVQPGAVAERVEDGSWRFAAGNWTFHSAAEHEFDRLEEGREELLRQGRRSGGERDRLLPQRCLVLKDTGWGTWRLWELAQGPVNGSRPDSPAR